MIDESKIAETIANLKIENYKLTKENESQKKIIDRLSRKIQRLKQEKLMYLGGFKESTKSYIEMLTRINKAIEWVYIVQQDKDNKHLEPIINTDELDEILEILKGADIND